MKAHQNVIIDGIDVGDKSVRKDSKFCNEGKWDNFINPLLPDDCCEKTFIEMGCNAGLFLKLASEKDFRTIIGIEKSRSTCKVAEKYRDNLGLDYKIINESLGEHFDLNALPISDITLMANFHYHLLMNDFITLLDRLQYKTCYCLVVSARVRNVAHWRPGAELNDIRLYFKDWKEIQSINYVSPEDDPHPRPMWSILFESRLKRKLIKDLWNPKNKDNGDNRIPQESTATLFQKVLNSDSIDDIRDSLYYKRVLRARVKDGWPRGKIDRFVQDKIDLMYDIKTNGFRSPILVRLDNRIIEGNHRLIMARELGYSSIITRTI